MIAVVNKATRAVILTRVSKVDRDRAIKAEQVAVIWGTRDSGQAQIAAISQDNKAISKAICQIVNANRASRKKRLQIATRRLTMMSRTQNSTKLPIVIRTRIAV